MAALVVVATWAGLVDSHSPEHRLQDYNSVEWELAASEVSHSYLEILDHSPEHQKDALLHSQQEFVHIDLFAMDFEVPP
jgi:hypothetical protein